MTFALYLPFDTADSNELQNSALKIPSILYLSGLTCTDENVCQKSGIFRVLSELHVSVYIYRTMISLHSNNAL